MFRQNPIPYFRTKTCTSEGIKASLWKPATHFFPAILNASVRLLLHDDILKFGETAFRRAQMAGVKTIVFGSGGARAIPDGFSREEAKQQFISICKQLAPFAKEI